MLAMLNQGYRPGLRVAPRGSGPGYAALDPAVRLRVFKRCR